MTDTERPTILLWIDIETTDATPDAQLLELYACWTEDGPNLIMLGEYHALSPAKPRMRMAPEVEAIHRESGLLEDLEANWAPPTDSDEWTDATLMHLWLENRRIAREQNANVTLAGSGIAHFDVPWLRAHKYGDRLVADCTYWLLDVGILRRTLAAAGITIPEETEPKAHRAKADVYSHAREFYRIRTELNELKNWAIDAAQNTGEDPQ